jgi:hypothetical protein
MVIIWVFFSVIVLNIQKFFCNYIFNISLCMKEFCPKMSSKNLNRKLKFMSQVENFQQDYWTFDDTYTLSTTQKQGTIVLENKNFVLWSPWITEFNESHRNPFSRKSPLCCFGLDNRELDLCVCSFLFVCAHVSMYVHIHIFTLCLHTDTHVFYVL